VYGHNMNDGSMFASVWEFRNKSYFQAHPVIELYSKSGEKVCPVFSAHEVKPDGDAYRLSFSGSKAYGAYLKQMKKDSLYDTGVDVAASDRVLTLSTCVRDGRDVRFLVHAKISG
jgi:SrtB family sortase